MIFALRIKLTRHEDRLSQSVIDFQATWNVHYPYGLRFKISTFSWDA